ncbi:secretion/DNA translocation related TadE-like protein [Allocatelliglobosispora scoriae]|uniref:Secretion/DNA translocation related TadE-like protein n=2 Tax=Allocatelliglobosispora scoriae TaxID=643052 RepID=A0A841BV39_9ACTN|nr:secretion/DNA translocation related TadE-like protein [Allocatelliglobosispora scoriae]
MIISLFAAASALIGTAVATRHQAQVAADLGALAGARRSAWGAAVACERAGAYVAANGAVLTQCRLDGLNLLVTAQVRWHGLSAEAVALAGPVL